MADEMAEPYYLYGKALLEVARQEAGVLGTAVPGMCCRLMHWQQQPLEEWCMSIFVLVRCTVFISLKAGTRELCILHASASREAPTLSLFCTIICVAENEPESNGESDGEEEKTGEDGAESGECGDDQPSASAEATKETSVESPKEEAQGMDVDESTAGTSAEGEQTGSSSKEPAATSQEKEGGCSSGDVDNEKGEGEDAEEDDVPTLQLAWEVLELARIIYDKEADKNGCRLAEIRLLLGEINMESGKGMCACVCA